MKTNLLVPVASGGIDADAARVQPGGKADSRIGAAGLDASTKADQRHVHFGCDFDGIGWGSSTHAATHD